MARDVRQLGYIHNHSIRHREEVEAARVCGCFYCLAVFPPSEIVDWVDEGEVTALCPRCGIDSVLSESTTISIDITLLIEMERHYFGLLSEEQLQEAVVRATESAGDHVL